MYKTKSQFSSTNPYYDQARLQTISQLLCNDGRMDELLCALGVKLYHTSKMYYGCCPIHGGDNPNAINIYRGGDVPGKWVCRTHHCENIFKRTIIGFVRGMLSQERCGWTKKGDRQVKFEEAVDWCCKFLSETISTIKVDHAGLEKQRFASGINTLTKKPDRDKSQLTRSQVRARLKIPSKYFIDRGWSGEVLNKYDVGLCDNPDKPFYDRIVVPVYDDDYRYCLGFTARSIHNQCEKCGLWHSQERTCPHEQERLRHSKWTNSKGFQREAHLYNYWFAKKHISKDGVAVLVEGPGDLWRLAESGIECGVAMFGSSLSDQQQIMLEMSGAMSIIILTDMDQAGRQCAETIKKDIGRSYRIFIPELPKADLGECSPAEVQQIVYPLLKKAKS